MKFHFIGVVFSRFNCFKFYIKMKVSHFHLGVIGVFRLFLSQNSFIPKGLLEGIIAVLDGDVILMALIGKGY